jgi:hypothetical protein
MSTFVTFTPACIRGLSFDSNDTLYVANYEENRIVHQYLMYDPYSVVKPQYVEGVLQTYKPIDLVLPIALDNDNSNGLKRVGFMDMARTRGIVFMYQLVSDQTSGQITY